MTKKFSRVTFDGEITREIYEHEIMLSFHDDYGAYAFDEWWHVQGAELFGDWCSAHPDYKQLMEP